MPYREFCEISKNTFFHRAPSVAASGKGNKICKFSLDRRLLKFFLKGFMKWLVCCEINYFAVFWSTILNQNSPNDLSKNSGDKV